jgi:hypothetical protein
MNELDTAIPSGNLHIAKVIGIQLTMQKELIAIRSVGGLEWDL